MCEKDLGCKPEYSGGRSTVISFISILIPLLPFLTQVAETCQLALQRIEYVAAHPNANNEVKTFLFFFFFFVPLPQFQTWVLPPSTLAPQFPYSYLALTLSLPSPPTPRVLLDLIRPAIPC